MKIHKPYLSLSKTVKDYSLEIVFTTNKQQNITSIVQQAVEKGGKTYWGVLITVSSKIQIVNGPENPILFTTVSIDLDKSEKYQTIKCIVEQSVDEDLYGPSEPVDSDIDFGDA